MFTLISDTLFFLPFDLKSRNATLSRSLAGCHKDILYPDKANMSTNYSSSRLKARTSAISHLFPVCQSHLVWDELLQFIESLVQSWFDEGGTVYFLYEDSPKVLNFWTFCFIAHLDNWLFLHLYIIASLAQKYVYLPSKDTRKASSLLVSVKWIFYTFLVLCTTLVCLALTDCARVQLHANKLKCFLI